MRRSSACQRARPTVPERIHPQQERWHLDDELAEQRHAEPNVVGQPGARDQRVRTFLEIVCVSVCKRTLKYVTEHSWDIVRRNEALDCGESQPPTVDKCTSE